MINCRRWLRQAIDDAILGNLAMKGFLRGARRDRSGLGSLSVADRFWLADESVQKKNVRNLVGKPVCAALLGTLGAQATKKAAQTLAL
jgi:hypothetical protein